MKSAVSASLSLNRFASCRPYCDVIQCSTTLPAPPTGRSMTFSNREARRAILQPIARLDTAQAR